MVATTPAPAEAFAAQPVGAAKAYEARSARPRPSEHHGVERLFVSLFRLVQIQTRILMLHTRFTAQKIAIGVGLFVGATVFAILGVIFLYISIFKIMTDEMKISAAWAYLILFLMHAVSAGLLVVLARKSLSSRIQGGKAQEKRTEGAARPGAPV